MQQLMKKLYNTVARKWNPIGTFLGMSEEELSAISLQECGDPQACLMAMLRAWLHQVNPQANWHEIAEAVEFTGRPDIAHQIRQMYCQHGPT